MQETTKKKIQIASLLILTALLPIIWLFISNFAMMSGDFSKDVYLDKGSVQIMGEKNISILLNLKNDSDNAYGGKFLHMTAIKDGEGGGLYADYELPFIGAHSTYQILVMTDWSREDLDDIKVMYRDEENRSIYISLNNYPASSNTKVINCVMWSAIIISSLILLYAAVQIQYSNNQKNDK